MTVDPGDGRRILDAVAASVPSPDALLRLARSLCLTVLIEPGHLRRARREFVPHTTLDLESDLWFSALVAARNSTGFVFSADVVDALRADLAAGAEPVGFAERAIALTELLHRDYPVLLRLEERLIAGVVLGESASELASHLRPAVRTLAGGGRRASEVARWVGQAWRRLPARALDNDEARALWAGASVLFGKPVGGSRAAPPALGTEVGPLTTRGLATVAVGVDRTAAGLRFLHPEDATMSLDVPRTQPLLIEVGWRLGGRRHRRLAAVRPGDLVPFDPAADDVELRTLAGARYRLELEDPAAGATPPRDVSWVAAVHVDRLRTVAGAGVLVDRRRIVTAAHVIRGAGAIEVTIGERRRVAAVRAVSEAADVAVLELEDSLGDGIRPAQLRFPRASALVASPWWSIAGPAQLQSDGFSLAGVFTGDRGDTRVELAVSEPARVERGWSGAGIWSTDFQAVVGIITHSDGGTALRGFTLAAAASALPGEHLERLAVGATEPMPSRDSRAAELGDWLAQARAFTADPWPGAGTSGRWAVLTMCVDWLGHGPNESSVLVLTGAPGSGKSTLLARLVVTADPVLAPELLAVGDAPRAPLGSVDCAVKARGRTALDIAREIALACDVEPPADLEDFGSLIRDALRAKLADGDDFVVLIDALDELLEMEAERTVGLVLAPLVDTPVRLLLATRRGRVLDSVRHALGDRIVVADLDAEPFFDLAELRHHVAERLRAQTRVDAASVDSLAQWIAERSAPSYLTADLLVRSLAGADLELALIGEDGITLTPGDALAGYLEGLPDIGGLDPVALMTVLSAAHPPGFSVSEWAAAMALVGEPGSSEQDVRAFVTGPGASLVDETTVPNADGSAVARFVTPLAVYLRSQQTPPDLLWRFGEIQARLVSSEAPSQWRSAAFGLVGRLRQQDHIGLVDSMVRLAADAAERAASDGDTGAARVAAELFVAARRPVEAMVWYERAAELGDETAVDEELRLLTDLPIPAGRTDWRPHLRRLPEQLRKPTALAVLGHEPLSVAVLLDLSEADAAEYVRRGLRLLDALLADATLPLSTGGVLLQGHQDPSFADYTTMPEQVIGGTLTSDEQAMVNLMDPKDRARYLLQRRVQEKAEMAVLLSQLQALRHQTAMTLITPIR